MCLQNHMLVSYKPLAISRPLCILKHKAALRSGTSDSDLNPQNKCQDQICQQTRRKSARLEQICSFELKDQELLRASMEALVNSLDTAALSREQLEAEVTKLRSENDQLRMDADDPFQLLRDLPEDEPRPSPSKLNRLSLIHI